MAETYDLASLLAAWRSNGQLYHEFLRVDALSAGIYHLGPDTPDPQRPHTEDEIYYVVGGQGEIEIEGKVMPLQAGSVIFVEKQARHRFLNYPEGLTLLVIFAPPRGSGAA